MICGLDAGFGYAHANRLLPQIDADYKNYWAALNGKWVCDIDFIAVTLTVTIVTVTLCTWVITSERDILTICPPLPSPRPFEFRANPTYGPLIIVTVYE